MEFVPESSAISAILKEYKSILNFLRFYNPNKYDTYGISSIVIDTFIKSCAASCVVSYILGM
jgi:phosphatidylinositol 3-kinase